MWSRAVCRPWGRACIVSVWMWSLWRWSACLKEGGPVARHCPYCSPLGGELTFPSSLCLLFFQEEMGQQRLCKSDQQPECCTTMAWRIVLLERDLRNHSIQRELGQCPWTLLDNTRYEIWTKINCSELVNNSDCQHQTQMKITLGIPVYHKSLHNKSRFRVTVVSTNWNISRKRFQPEAPRCWGICINMTECVRTTTLPGVFTSHLLVRQEFKGVALWHKDSVHFYIEVSTNCGCQGVAMSTVLLGVSYYPKSKEPNLSMKFKFNFSDRSQRRQIWSSRPRLTQSMSNSSYLASTTAKNELCVVAESRVLHFFQVDWHA